MIELYAINVEEEIEPNIWQKLLGLVSEQRRIRANKFLFGVLEQ